MQTPLPAFIQASGPVSWRQAPLPARCPRRSVALAPPCRAAPRATADPTPPRGGADSVAARMASRAAADTALLARGARDAALVAMAAAVLATGGVSSDTGLSLVNVMAPATVHAEVPTSAPGVGVVDDAGVVGKSEEELFGRAASAIETRTGVRVRFVVTSSIAYGTTPDEYAAQLATEWGLGSKDVLFAASTKLARAGVFVGDDVAARLPADVARSVAEETYGVPAGAERYGAALLGVSNRLIPLLNGEADPGPPSQAEVEASATYKTKEETKNDRGKYIKIVGGVLVIAFVAPLLQTYWYVRND